MADDTNTHEGLGAMSDEQIKAMENVVKGTDHPYKDPITGKMNVDIPQNEVGVSRESKAAKKAHEDRDRMEINREEEAINANQWEDPLGEDR